MQLFHHFKRRCFFDVSLKIVISLDLKIEKQKSVIGQKQSSELNGYFERHTKRLLHLFSFFLPLSLLSLLLLLPANCDHLLFKFQSNFFDSSQLWQLLCLWLLKNCGRRRINFSWIVENFFLPFCDSTITDASSLFDFQVISISREMTTVCPDAKIKRSQNFTIRNLMSGHSSYYLKDMFFIVAQKVDI